MYVFSNSEPIFEIDNEKNVIFSETSNDLMTVPPSAPLWVKEMKKDEPISVIQFEDNEGREHEFIFYGMRYSKLSKIVSMIYDSIKANNDIYIPEE